jgi:NAD(P)-dependent dehydrogenase (short-subunit alcohol dehydrogenase family)
MARVFITGSADGLGRAAAQTLREHGHEVVVHVRNQERLAAVRDLADAGAVAVVGDLSDLEETRGVADQVNRLGPMDAVIHNAGVISGPQVLSVNVAAPYLLTALIHRPKRLVYLSSGMHHGGRASLAGIDWAGRRTTASYSDSKLFVTTLAAAVARSGRTCSATRWTLAGCPRGWAAPVRPTICGSATSRRSGSPPATTPKPAPPALIGITNAAPSPPAASTTSSSKSN